MECGAPPLIQLTLDEIKARYLMDTITPQERDGIESNVNSDGLTVLTLPAKFHWVPVSQAALGLFRRLHLATVPNGVPRIQVVFNAQNEIVEVNILKLN
jgi:hypothetical protein